MRRWVICMALGVLGCNAEPKPKPKPESARPELEDDEPELPKRIVQASEECRQCKLSEQGTCELHWRWGCGDATCGAEIVCDPECCSRPDGVSIAELTERAKTGWIEGITAWVEPGRSFEIDGVTHHRRVEHIVAQESPGGTTFWFVETNHPQDQPQQRSSMIWLLDLDSHTLPVQPLLAEPVGWITDLEHFESSLLFTTYSEEHGQTTVHRVTNAAGRTYRPESLGTWPDHQVLTRSKDGSLFVLGETGVAIDPSTMQQTPFGGELAEQTRPELERCNVDRPGEPPDPRAVQTFGEHLVWLTPMDNAEWDRVTGAGRLGLIRHCHLRTGKVETLGLVQAPSRDEDWALHYAWTDPLLAVALADGVFIEQLDQSR